MSLPLPINPMKQMQVATGQYKWSTPEANAGQQSMNRGQFFDRDALNGYSRMANEMVGGADQARMNDKMLNSVSPSQQDRIAANGGQLDANGVMQPAQFSNSTIPAASTPGTTMTPGKPMQSMALQQDTSKNQLGALLGQLVGGLT
jgi:hypothetical protein